MDVVIKNATIITNKDNEVLHHAQIHIKDGKIEFVGKHLDAQIQAERIIDAKSKIVMPGMFNMHAHLPMTLLRGYADDLSLQDWLFTKIFPAEEKLSEEMVYWSTLAGLYELASSGVVCYNEMYTHMDAVAQATQESGLRAVLARGITAQSPKEAEDKIKEALRCYEKHHHKDRMTVYMAPHAQYTVDNQTLQLLASYAKELDTGMHIHVSETKKEHDACVQSEGLTPIALFEKLGLLEVPTIAAHCVWVSDADIQIMKEHNVTVASCPRSNLKLASGIAPLQKMLESGVNVALGTDSAASNNKLSLFSEMTFASFMQKGVTNNPKAVNASQAIEMATVNGAKAVRINSGIIQVGRNADIIILNSDNLRYSPAYDTLASVVYASGEQDVALTMVGGDIIYEQGECAFADKNEIMERLEKYAEIISA